MGRRFVLWSLLVAVALLLATAAAGRWYLASGRLARRIEIAFSKYLPAQLSIGSMEVRPETITLRSMMISGEGEKPLAVINEARIRISYHHLRPQLERIDINGAHLRLDLRSWDLLNRVIDAIDQIPSSAPAPGGGQERKIPIVVTSGSVDLGGCAQLVQVQADAISCGPDTRVAADARCLGRPLHADIHIHPDGDRRLMEIDTQPWTPPLQPLVLMPILDGAAAIGLMAPPPPALRPYLPAEIDARGTRVVHDLKADIWTGTINGHWLGGSVQGQISADTHVIALPHLVIEDPARVSGEGSLSCDTDDDRLHVDLQRWVPGPMLLIPDVVPVAAILAVVPQLKLDFSWHNDIERVAATLSASRPSEAVVQLDWTGGGALQVGGASLPLVLAQSFLPAQVLISDGLAEKVAMTILPSGFSGCTLEASQARLGAFGWSVGDLDGVISITPDARGLMQIDSHLTRRQGGGRGDGTVMRIGSVGWTGHPAGGVLSVRLARVEDLLIRLHGPLALPDLRGALDLDLDLTAAADGSSCHGQVQRLLIESMAMPDLLQDFAASIRGDFTWRAHHIDATLGGQLRHGKVCLPGTWLDAATRTPIFTANVTYTPAIGFAPAELDLNEVLVRSADAQGAPLASGYSAQLAGNLTADGTGEITGVVDHADLAWVNSLLSLGALSISGEGALAFSADLMQAQMTRLQGDFLPLNAEAHIGNYFKSTGITGEIKFTMAKDAEDPPASEEAKHAHPAH